MERSILHCDCNNFYASVECVFRPELKAVPMAVCGNPENRHGIILAKNDLAKAQGVKTAQTIWQAKNNCPDLVLVPPRHDAYTEFSRRANQIYESYTDLVEPFGIDESWLDVTGSRRLFGSGEEIAHQIRNRMKQELGITVSVGVSFNKVFAKLGSDYQKPDAVTVITRENYKQIIHPLPISELLFVGRSATNLFERMYIKTIGDLAASDKSVLTAKLGKIGTMLHDYANGLDNSPVESFYAKREVKSIGKGLTFRRNLQTLDDTVLAVNMLSEMIAFQMRRKQLKCLCVQVVIKDANLKSISRQVTLQFPTFLAREIAWYALQLIRKNWDFTCPIRMISVTGAHLIQSDATTDFSQLSLFETQQTDVLSDAKRSEQLEETLYRLKDKYGKTSIVPGSYLKNDIGLE